jgi:hypothetical protein
MLLVIKEKNMGIIEIEKLIGKTLKWLTQNVFGSAISLIPLQAQSNRV